MQHECFLAYAPRGAGLLCAVTYVSGEPDIVGWFVGAKGNSYPSAYFRVENFFAAEQKRFWATAGSDIYGGWRYDYARGDSELDPTEPVDDDLCHVLDRLEDVFVAEWLVFKGDLRFDVEKAVYAREGWVTSDVLIEHRKLAKFDREGPAWTFYSHGFNDEVLRYLIARWPLDHYNSSPSRPARSEGARAGHRPFCSRQVAARGLFPRRCREQVSRRWARTPSR